MIDKLSAQKEVIKVNTVYVDKSEAFIDENNLKWNSVDISLSSKENVKVWKDLNFRKNIFSKCFLWESYSDESGEFSRENLRFRIEQKRISERRLMGYLV